jgi:hypothetical protein
MAPVHRGGGGGEGRGAPNTQNPKICCGSFQIVFRSVKKKAVLGIPVLCCGNNVSSNNVSSNNEAKSSDYRVAAGRGIGGGGDGLLQTKKT